QSHRALSEHKTLSISWSHYQNELENSEDGAGQIGFQLSNDGTNEIQYGKSNYYSFQHPHEGSNQIPLFIRPRTYGNNVSSGQIMSRVKIVVMYN
ncbi:hypothetical protein FHE33_22855, partial [Escherichia coli O157:H7]|nr:hypothetical protein [Escherichia coli O157:H7]EFB2691805.1 hypothetical protein [Escherichia coli O157:H7]EFB2710036.1 hypothetical protein [Escherichia coli O157:H7]EFB2719062.1 hypothetical protein [Escherichia coli O157:H7]EFB2727845.1 hypothetical protein [Escherichia coli O157:H7]